MTPPAVPPYPRGYLACVDAATLQPAGDRAELAEFHGAWALSPDRSQVAVGLSAPGAGGSRVHVRVFDARTFALATEITTGAFADAIAWRGPRRMVVRSAGRAMLIDPVARRVLRRRRLGPVGGAVAVAAGRVLMLARTRPGLLVVDGASRVAVARLPRALGAASRLLVDGARGRAYVVGARRLAEVSLGSLRVRVRALRGGRVAWPSRIAPAAGRSATRDRGEVAWLRPGGIALVASAGEGARLVDVRRGRSRLIDRRASGVAATGGAAVTYGRDGLRIWRAGRGATASLRGKRLVAGEVALAAGHAYAASGNTMYVVDLADGRVRGRLSPPPTLQAAIPLDCGG